MLPSAAKFRASRLVGLGVDAVYVLSVRSSHERIAHVERELAKHRIPFEFIFDFDAVDLTPVLLRSRFAMSNLSLADRSLVLKHIHAWRLACQRGYKRILVFEDDVLLHEKFAALLEKALEAIGAPPGWLVFLGAIDMRGPDSSLLERGPLVQMPIATAESYVTDLTACWRRMEWCVQHKVTLPLKHLIRHIDASVGIRQYWLTEAIVQQSSLTK
jgi:glycosyl transferase family 25